MSTSVTTQHNDNSRTGANLQETALNTGNVNPQRFGKLFERSVDGHIYAQPLYLPGVNVVGHGVRNVVYVATMRNTVYAFDADDKAAALPLWAVPLGPAVPLPDNNVGGPGYKDIAEAVGVVSTPVISTEHNAIYVIAATKENNNYFHRLHALELTSGRELFNGPRVITASVPGSGEGSSQGVIHFTSFLQNQRPGLLLANDIVYAAFASYGDHGPYHGWVLGFHAATLAPLPNVFNVTPDGAAGGIWMAGQGIASDSENNLYFITGNGTFSELSITGKATLPETAVGTPAIVNINDASLGLAWTGTDGEHHLNVETSTDGQSFTGKITLNETSFDGPGFAFGNGLAYIAWTGNDPDHRLNVMSSRDCRNFSNKVTLGDTSNSGPALAFGNNKLFLAWTGKDPNSSLNVMSSADGIHFGNKVTLAESTATCPGLAFLDGKLYLLWRGTDPDHKLNIMESTDGIHFVNKITSGETSDYHPALTKLGDFKLAWTGRDQKQSLNLLSGSVPGTLSQKETFGDTAAAAPMLAAYKGQLMISWTGTDPDHHVNVAHMSASPMLGDSFVKLRPDLMLADWFSPWNTQALNAADDDLGSGGALLIPNTNLLIGGGKEGKLYFLDCNHLGHFCATCGNPAGDTQIVQWWQAAGVANHGTPPPPAPEHTHHIHGSPVFWNVPQRGPTIYIGAEADWIRAFTFNGTHFNTTPADTTAFTTPARSMPGAMLSISAHGSTAGTGILWASHPIHDNANQAVVDGMIRALDASNLQHELWNSEGNQARDSLGKIAKFTPLTVVNGKVYAATFSHKLAVYGLL